MKQKQSFEEWIQDYLKGARNKGREKGKIKQGRDRRERKEEKWGGERSRKSILLGHIRRSLTMWQNLSSFCSHEHFTIVPFLSIWQMTHTYFHFHILSREKHITCGDVIFLCSRTILCDTVWENKTKHNHKTPIHTFVCTRRSRQEEGGKARAQLFSKVFWFAFSLIEPFHPRMKTTARSLEPTAWLLHSPREGSL